MDEFRKRKYESITEFIDDIKFLLKNHKKIKSVQNGKMISDDFRERLMMAVTAVNGCRYCSFFHSRLALKSGISSEELDFLLDGTLKDSPDNQKLALFYAQHWTENGGEADKDFEEKLVKMYGNRKAMAIKLALRSIYFGNLLGNTFDYILYKITFGKIGNS